MLKRLLSLTLIALVFLNHSYASAQVLAELTQEEKLAIYEQKKENPEDAVRLNWIPFGVGSRMQGEQVTAGAITVLDVIALTGLASSAFAVDDIQTTSGGFQFLGGIAIGISSYVFGRMIGISSVYEHSKIHNAKLRKELGLPEEKQEPALPYHDNWTNMLFSYSTHF